MLGNPKVSFGMRFFCIVLSAQHSAFSDDGYVAPPVPIPNTAVKHIHAESTWLGTAREDRESLILLLDSSVGRAPDC